MPRIETDCLTAEQFLHLFTSVGWEAPGVEQIETALENSLATFTAHEDGRAVGMARLLGDRGMSYYVKDFAVHPDYQGRGIGGLLMNAIEEYVASDVVSSWAVSLELISTPQAVEFYKRHGFETRPCDGDGPGMLRMIRSR